jgi:FRG domain
MAEIQTIRCDGWEEFKTTIVKQLFHDKPFQKSRFLFRGQADPDWRLISSYDRWFNEQGLEESRRMEIAAQMLASFKQELKNAGHEQLVQEEGDPHIMAIAQHYGLPTRLLDWSESPYVAAFFAFVDVVLLRLNPDSVVVWALDTTNYCWEGYGARIVSVASPRSNVRLRNQEGKFTILETLDSCLEDFVGKTKVTKAGGIPLRRFFIPGGDTISALAELDAMGINPSRAYSDLQGYAMAARVQQQLRVLSRS